MFNMSKIFIGIAICSMLGSVTLMADHNKHQRKGKPFVQVNDQLIEISGAISSLQDQVDLLVAKVNTVEERATALEVAMTDLESNNAVMQAMINQNATDITSVNQAIANLQEENAALKLEVEANSGGVQSANDKIAANEALIVSLQSAIIQLENGSVAADADLQAMIEDNQALISTMQAEINNINQGLALKQNIISGTCPNDQAVVAVGENSISCGSVGGSVGSLSVYTTYGASETDTSGEQVIATCSDNDLLLGGGFFVNTLDVFFSGPSPDVENAWLVIADPTAVTYGNPFVISIARCMKIN